MEYKKPLYPILRDGDTNLLNSDTWSRIANIQYTNVRHGNLPPDGFFNKLASKAPRIQTAAVLTPPQPPSAVGTPFLASAAQPVLPLPDVTEILPPPFEWCDIPAGQVTLEAGGYLKSQTTFEVAAFKMAKYPITNTQYAVFMKDGYPDPQWWDYSTEAKSWRMANPRSIETAFESDDLPRTNVNWYDALAFCLWLSALSGQNIALPTEQQWQWAAQGPDGRQFPWGNEPPDKNRANFGSNIKKPTPVTQYPKGESPFHVMDMSGNVWEWCLNEWGIGEIDLHNRNSDIKRVLRGGSWDFDLNNIRATIRNRNYPYFGDYSQGFRLSLLATSDL